MIRARALRPVMRRRIACALFLLLLASPVASLRAQNKTADNTIVIDATSPAPAPQPVPMQLQWTRSPDGQTLGANSVYLTRDGKAWLPVMGEFHFSRYPQAEWNEELLKMKAAGINIVSTYVIWIHQEQNQGQFDWSGQRDLRRFIELCQQDGLYVIVRLGPWTHGEVRNGGLPDWVLKNSPVRQNNPIYLREVDTYFQQIGEQLRGELWKDGGPVIGAQIENEYSLRGPGKGDAHILALKKIAIAAGIQVPFYTVTGWDGAAIPLNQVLPVYGGYPAAPWSGTSGPLAPSEIYAFRFSNRVAGNMGAIGSHGQNSAASYQGTPFLTAEVGSGIEDTYFRRPVVSSNDIASIVPVLLGSGVNMLGFYMFHGGRNPSGGAITLQESQRTGYPTDVPVNSYDFQAPLGEFGQERASLGKLKLTNYFLNDFGADLAPMAVRAPSELPSNPADTKPVRLAARTSGDHGFIFFNNYVRGLTMPARADFQVELKLPSGTVRVPRTPITLPSGSYGIWPVNLPVGSDTLRYSTAQLFKRVTSHDGRTSSLWFFALPGVAPEFLLAPGAHVRSTSNGVEQSVQPDGVLLRMSGSSEESIELTNGISLIVIPKERAEQVWSGGDPSVLLATSAWAYTQHERCTLLQPGNPVISFGIFGDAAAPQTEQGTLSAETSQPDTATSLFHSWSIAVPSVSLPVTVQQVQGPQRRGPWVMGPKLAWRPQPIPLAPDAADFKAAARWTLHLPPINWSSTLADALLRINYQGDVARLSFGASLIDDNFWNGLPWEIGLRETEDDLLPQSPDSRNTPQQAPSIPATTLDLSILPLPKNFPMYIQRAAALHFSHAQADSVQSIELVPVYRAVVTLKHSE